MHLCSNGRRSPRYCRRGSLAKLTAIRWPPAGRVLKIKISERMAGAVADDEADTVLIGTFSETDVDTKKTPKQSTRLGVLSRCLNLGSEPGGGVSGDGVPPGWALTQLRYKARLTGAMRITR